MRSDFTQALETANEKLLSVVFKEAQKRVGDTFLQKDKILLQSQYQSSLIVSKVLKKGHIESADEYEILLDRVEELLGGLMYLMKWFGVTICLQNLYKVKEGGKIN
ncbi:MAG: hypothetical protein PHP85_05960 [Gallionella sp.]|nr:hypothetical protein [Gallionella sp.]